MVAFTMQLSYCVVGEISGRVLGHPDTVLGFIKWYVVYCFGFGITRYSSGFESLYRSNLILTLFKIG